jgi:hypothetical protein
MQIMPNAGMAEGKSQREVKIASRNMAESRREYFLRKGIIFQQFPFWKFFDMKFPPPAKKTT